jgi:uncharacterized protein YaaN involved in tellurite resistance
MSNDNKNSLPEIKMGFIDESNNNHIIEVQQEQSYFPQQQMNNGFQQQQMNNGFPQQQMNNGFQQQQMNNGFQQQQMNNGFQQQQRNNGFPQQQMNNGFPQQQMNDGFEQQQMNNGFPQQQMNDGFQQQQMNNGFEQQQMNNGFPQQQMNNGFQQNADNSTTQLADVKETSNTESGRYDDSMLSEAEKKQVNEVAKKINLRDTQVVLQYGTSSQTNISKFSESILSSVKLKDSGEVGNMLMNLTTELKGFTTDSEPKKGFLGIVKKGTNQISNLKSKYTSVEENINKITDSLELNKVQLLKDISMLDKMYDKNLEYFKELTMYLIAGKRKLNESLSVELPFLKQKATQSGQQQDVQAARDFEDMCNRFDKKLHDLDLTRTISMQTAPQIRLIQNNDTVLVEKIQTSIVNTIPLWKSQMVMALSLANSQKSLASQRAVSDMTNQLLKKNADMLKINTIEISKEAERGIIDIETIKYTNEQLISTLEEVMQIQEEGRQNRRSAESELTQIESDLKRTLLSVSS